MTKLKNLLIIASCLLSLQAMGQKKVLCIGNSFTYVHDAYKRLGEIAGAVIQLKEGMTATEDEINQFCEELPRYKRPRKIIFAPVPRNPTGKIEKPKLRKIYGQEHLVAYENEG